MSGNKGFYRKFKGFYKEMYGLDGRDVDADYLLHESGSMEEDDQRLGALGAFFAQEARKVDPEIDIDSALEMDYAEHKNHFVLAYSDVEIGGKAFRVTLWETEYMNGRIADNPQRFNAEAAEDVRDIVGGYHHVLNHVKAGFDDAAYNPIADYFRPAKR